MRSLARESSTMAITFLKTSVFHSFSPLLLLLFLGLRRCQRVTYRSALFYGLLFAVCLTCVLLLVAKFPTYYSYMIVIPVAVAVCSGLSLSEAGASRRIALLLCFVSCICGAVANTAAYVSEPHDHNYTRMQNFVNDSVH